MAGADDAGTAEGQASEMQLLQLENSSLKQKVRAFEKQSAGGVLGNEYNPQYLKLQNEFNEKEREVLRYLDRIDVLEQ
jgi:hypothetical protein